LTDKAEDAVQMMSSGLAAYRSTGSTNYILWWCGFPTLMRTSIVRGGLVS